MLAPSPLPSSLLAASPGGRLAARQERMRKVSFRDRNIPLILDCLLGRSVGGRVERRGGGGVGVGGARRLRQPRDTQRKRRRKGGGGRKLPPAAVKNGGWGGDVAQWMAACLGVGWLNVLFLPTRKERG